MQRLVIDRYEPRDILGRSDLGTTHLSSDVGNGELLAVKVFAPPVDLGHSDGLRYRHAIERAAGLEHPHLIVPNECGLAAGSAFQVSPYFPAESLGSRMGAGPDGAQGWPAEYVQSLLAQLASALSALHGRGLRHGNLKPGNVLISQEDGDLHAVLCDPFLGGLRGPDAHLLPGEAPWRAPEEAPWLEWPVDGRADAYSLGVLGFRLLTGRWPHPPMAPVPAFVRRWGAPPPSAREWVAELPEGLDELVAGLLAPDPAGREAAFAELAILGTPATAAGPHPGPVAVPAGRGPGQRPDPLRWRVDREGLGKLAEALRAAVAQAAAGRGSPVVIEAGPAGAGNAAESLRGELEAGRATVLRVELPEPAAAGPLLLPTRAFETLARRWAYLDDQARGALLESLHSRIGENGALLTGAVPELGSLLPGREPPPPIPADRARARMLTVWADAFCALGRAGHPVVLWVDGAERLDGDSLDWLRALMLQLSGAHVALVLAGHVEADNAAGEWLREAAAHPGAFRLPAPLRGAADTADWLAARLGAAAGDWRDAAQWLHGRTGGRADAQAQALPLLLDWGALDPAADPAAGGVNADDDAASGDGSPPRWNPTAAESADPPHHASGWIARRLEALDEPLYLTLEALAGWPEGAPLERLTAAQPNLPADVLLRRLDGLIAAGLVREGEAGFRVQGESLRREALGRMDGLRRVRLHEALGALWESDPAGPPLLAAHAAAHHMGQAGDGDRTATALLALADAARKHHALRAAAAAYESLAATDGDGARLGAVFAGLGEARLRLGEPAAARTALEQALRLAPNADVEADALTLLARAEWAAGDRGAALGHLESALQMLGDPLPGHAVGTALARVATGAAARYQRLLGNIGAAVTALPTPAESRRTRLLELAAEWLAASHPARAALAGERLLAQGEGRVATPPIVRALIRLGEIEGDPEAPLLKHAEALLADGAFPHEAARLAHTRGRLLAARLALTPARRALGQARDAFRRLGDPLGEAGALHDLLFVMELQSPPAALVLTAGELAGRAALGAPQALRQLALGWRAYGEALGGTRPLPANQGAIAAIEAAATACMAAGDGDGARECATLLGRLHLLAGGSAAALSALGRHPPGRDAEPPDGWRLRMLEAEALLAQAGAPGAPASHGREARAALRALRAERRRQPALGLHLGALEVMAAGLERDATAIRQASEAAGTALAEAEARIPLAWLHHRTAEALKAAGEPDWTAWAGKALTAFDALDCALARQATRSLLELDAEAAGAQSPRPDGSASLPSPARATGEDSIQDLLAMLATGRGELPEELHDRVLRQMQGALEAERGAIFLADETGAPQLRAVRGQGSDTRAGWVSRWLVERVWESRPLAAALLEHYRGGPEDASGTDLGGLEPQSLLAVPLGALASGGPRGVACFGSTMRRQVFGEPERLYGERIGQQAGTVLALAETLAELRAAGQLHAAEAGRERRTAAWSRHAAALESEQALLAVFLRDAGEPAGFTAAATVWRDAAGHDLRPGALAVTEGEPSGAASGGTSPVDDGGWGRLPEALERQQPAWIQGRSAAPAGDAGQALLDRLHGAQGLWLPAVLHGESMGALLLALPPGTARPGEDAMPRLTERVQAVAPALARVRAVDALRSENGRLRATHTEQERQIARLREAVPPALLAAWDAQATAAPPPEVREATVLAGRYWGLPGLARLAPGRMQAELEGYFRQVEQGLALHGGRLVRTWPGAWLAQFDGAPESALWSALTLIELVAGWREETLPETSFLTGMGIHRGPWAEALVRLERFAEAVPVAPAATLALALAARNARYRTRVLVSQASVDALPEPERFALRALGSARLEPEQGRSPLHELYGGQPAERRRRMHDAAPTWRDALRHYRAARWREAAAAFEAYLGTVPEDRPARLFLRRCRNWGG